MKQAFSWPGIFTAVVGLVLMGFGIAPASAVVGQPKPWEVTMQPAASPIMSMVRAFNNGTLLVITVIVLFVLALLVIVMIRFNARRNPVASKTSHNTLVEVVWTVVPILILVGIALPSFTLLIAQHDPARALPSYDPEKTLTVKATGSQWYWSYSYPDHEGVDFDSIMLTDAEITDPATQPRLLAVNHEMVVPVGTVIDMQVIGADVIHSFAVPSLGFKIDAVPGRLNSIWFLVEQEGVYYGQCSELCGRDHAFMPIAIRAVSQEKFDAWVVAAAEDIDTSYAVLTGPGAEVMSPEGAAASE